MELADILLRKDKGEPDEIGEHARVIANAVADVVQRQADAGIVLPSDG